MKKEIKLPQNITDMLRRNAELIERLQHESRLLLTGFMSGSVLVDTEKQYQPNADYTALIEIENG